MKIKSITIELEDGSKMQIAEANKTAMSSPEIEVFVCRDVFGFKSRLWVEGTAMLAVEKVREILGEMHDPNDAAVLVRMVARDRLL